MPLLSCRLKTQAQQAAQEKLHVEEEKDSILVTNNLTAWVKLTFHKARNEEMQKQLAECQSILKHGNFHLLTVLFVNN